MHHILTFTWVDVHDKHPCAAHARGRQRLHDVGMLQGQHQAGLSSHLNREILEFAISKILKGKGASLEI